VVVLRSNERILTSHVGSLIRPVEVMKVMRAVEQGLPEELKADARVGPPIELPAFVGPITYTGMRELQAELGRLKRAHAAAPTPGAFVLRGVRAALCVRRAHQRALRDR
jgi:hypothetical protein